MAQPRGDPGARRNISARPEQRSDVPCVPGRMEGGNTGGGETFRAFRVLSYPTYADRAGETNGRPHYVMTERETRETRARRSTGEVAAPLEVVEVVLQAGHFRVWTAEGRCGITDARGIIGLDLAIRTGVAAVLCSP